MWCIDDFYGTVIFDMKEEISAYIKILHQELRPVMGCTEPAAAALAGAVARELLDEPLDHILIKVSRDIIKNVMGVGIPYSSSSGLATAVLLGTLYGKAEQSLNILSSIEKPNESTMQTFIKQKKVEIVLVTHTSPLYIEVTVFGATQSASATIAEQHDMIIEKTKNGKVVFARDPSDKSTSQSMEVVKDWTLEDILDFVDHSKFEECGFLLEMAKINQNIGEHGLEKPYGLSVGKTAYATKLKTIETLDQAFEYAAALSASASDARMSGCTMPVVINSGSGNQGVTAMLGPLVVAEFLHVDELIQARSLALSNLVAIYLAQYKGRLSALCGAFTAAIGTCCAYVYLLGGTHMQIIAAIETMLANLAGIICDGAKLTCALKIHSCLQSAAMTANLVLKQDARCNSVGIIGKNIESTIANMEILCHQGMEETDKTILKIMVGASNY